MTGNPLELFKPFLVLFTRIFGFVGPFWTLMILLPARLQKRIGEIFLIFAGKSCGKFGGNYAGFFRTHQKQRLKKFGENIGAFFVTIFVVRKNPFVQTSFCRRATLTDPP